MGARAIGIDVGTSGVRAAALADDGATVGSAAVAMATFGDATAPATWWNCVRAVIAELGSDVRGWSVGDRVTAYFRQVCGVCLECRTGPSAVGHNGGLFSRRYPGYQAKYQYPADALFLL